MPVFPILIFAVSMLLSILSNGYTATYYVAKTGTDGNSCANAQSQSKPKLTIAQGVACLSSGDTLIIRAGTYNEIVPPLPSGKNWNNTTTVRGATGEAVVIRPNIGRTVLQLNCVESYLIYENLTLDGNNTLAPEGIHICENGLGQAAHHIRLKDVLIRGMGSVGFFVGSVRNGQVLGGFNEFINVTVLGPGVCNYFGDALCPHGFYVNSGNNLFDGVIVDGYKDHGVTLYDSTYVQKVGNIFRNCIFRNNDGAGMQLFSGVNTVIENTLIYGNKSGGMFVGFGMTGTTIRNNTIYNNVTDAIYFQDASSGNQLINNIIYTNFGAGIHISNGPSVLVRNNLASQNGGGNFRDQPGAATLQNNLFGDSYNPKLVNTALQDFHLSAGSAAIDVGLTIEKLTEDKDGVARPQGQGYDIGAYEYRTNTLSPPANFRLKDISK